jgi:hypothetical protein
MFWNRNVKLCLIALMTAGLVASVGCGDDPQTGENNPPGQNNPPGGENNPPGGENNPPGNNTPGNNTPGNNTPGENNPPGGGIPLAPGGSKCTDNPAPERCAATDFDTVSWSPASYVSALSISMEFDADGEASCCFDFDGDGKLDNGLGDLLDQFGALLGDTDPNAALQESIDEGSLVIVLEHAGLTDLAAGNTYDVNFLIGSSVDTAAKEVTINPSSFEDGAHPHAQLPNAKIQGTKLTAGPGSVFLSIPLLDIELNIVLRNAMVEANVVGSTIDGGVQLSNGKLGGILPVQGIYDAINDFAATCDCLSYTGDLISTNGDVTSCAAVTNTCDSGDVCSTIAENCNLIPIAGAFTDLDVDGDGQPDAFSLGFNFEADAVVITGVAAD